ncbi:hypothetical protein HK405_006394, partial [Cladochytrium tenue]
FDSITFIIGNRCLHGFRFNWFIKRIRYFYQLIPDRVLDISLGQHHDILGIIGNFPRFVGFVFEYSHFSSIHVIWFDGNDAGVERDSSSEFWLVLFGNLGQLRYVEFGSIIFIIRNKCFHSFRHNYFSKLVLCFLFRSIRVIRFILECKLDYIRSLDESFDLLSAGIFKFRDLRIWFDSFIFIVRNSYLYGFRLNWFIQLIHCFHFHIRFGL